MTVRIFLIDYGPRGSIKANIDDQDYCFIDTLMKMNFKLQILSTSETQENRVTGLTIIEVGGGRDFTSLEVGN